MKKIIILLVLAALPGVSWAAGGSADLPEANIDLNDKVSMRRGAQLYVNYCQGCHSAKYMRVNRLAKDLGIPEKLAKEELLIGTDKIGSPMLSNIPADKSKLWFGTPPPDLSLTGRLRGGDWLYAYLRSFYRDPGAPSGWNNTVFENVAMPHVLVNLQGVQEMVDDGNGGHTLKLVSQGSMTAEEYDTASRDLAAFLTYVGEPAQLVRKTWGIYVMAFLFILFVLSYFLKKEYWRDVR